MITSIHNSYGILMVLFLERCRSSGQDLRFEKCELYICTESGDSTLLLRRQPPNNHYVIIGNRRAAAATDLSLEPKTRTISELLNIIDN